MYICWDFVRWDSASWDFSEIWILFKLYTEEANNSINNIELLHPSNIEEECSLKAVNAHSAATSHMRTQKRKYSASHITTAASSQVQLEFRSTTEQFLSWTVSEIKLRSLQTIEKYINMATNWNEKDKSKLGLRKRTGPINVYTFSTKMRY